MMFKFMYHPTLLWRTQEESWPGEWLGDATSFHPFDIKPLCNIGRSPHRWGYGPWWACLEKTEWIAFTLIFARIIPMTISPHAIPKTSRKTDSLAVTHQFVAKNNATKGHSRCFIFKSGMSSLRKIGFCSWCRFCWNMAHLRSLPIKPSHA